MTPDSVKEMAEKISKLIKLEATEHHSVLMKFPLDECESLLRQMVEEAHCEAVECTKEKPCTACVVTHWNERRETALKEARAQALEEAAKFIETYRRERVGEIETYYGEDNVLADKIRQLKDNEKKGA